MPQSGVSFTGHYLYHYQKGGGEDILLGRHRDWNYILGERIVKGNQALFFIKVPQISIDGAVINVMNKGDVASSTSVFSNPEISGLIAHYKFDEGEGTILNNSVSGGLNANLTIGSGAWQNIGLQKVGHIYPPITTSGKSFYFNGSYASIYGSNISPSFQITKNFSVVMWIKEQSQ